MLIKKKNHHFFDSHYIEVPEMKLPQKKPKHPGAFSLLQPQSALLSFSVIFSKVADQCLLPPRRGVVLVNANNTLSLHFNSAVKLILCGMTQNSGRRQ